MPKLWFEKGHTGEVLREVRRTESRPIEVRLEYSTAFIYAPGKSLFGLTVRGSSKCRRKQARILERWLNAGAQQ